MPVNFEYILLLLVAFIPVYYKFSFWFYLIQLKEYRLDRFKEYINTRQWISAIFNLWFLIEIPLFIISLFIFTNNLIEIIIFPTIFYLFVIENIFYFWKIFRWKIIKPKFTLRLLITKLILFIIILCELYFLIFAWYIKFIFLFLFSLSIFTYLYIFLSILISLPFVNFLKTKKIKKAINISNLNKNIIKVWITWSYWKSSVKEFLSEILEQEKNTLKTPENINSELWVSDIIINKLNDKFDYFIAEMWAYKKWEISKLWEIVNHKYWFLTAIWNQHIWLFWNQEKIIEAKFEILNNVLLNDWVLYVNWDNIFINNYIKKRKISKDFIVKYWTNKETCDAIWTFHSFENKYLIFDFEYKNKKEKFKTNILWKHNIINLTWIIAFCIDQNISIDNIKKYLLNLTTPKNTLNILDKKINNFDIKIIDDTYNLSYEWLFAWIELLNSFWEKFKKILVVDDILELWKDAKNIHERIWFKIAKESLVDKIYLVWVNYKKQLIKWLLDWGFLEENILTNLKNIDSDTIFLLEWRNAKNFKFY